MNKSLLLLPVVAMSILFSGCGMNVLRGEGKKTTETREVTAFESIDAGISSHIIVNVIEGARAGVEIYGYENILKHVRTEVSGNVLHVRYDLDDTWTVNDGDMELRVTVPHINGLSLSGSPDADIKGNVTGDKFNLEISGASDVVIENLNTKAFSADMSGQSDLEVKGGSVVDAEYDISGAGQITAFNLRTENTSASISGAAKSEVYATKKLDVSISGAGEVVYKGSPAVEKHVSGMGSVTPAKDE